MFAKLFAKYNTTLENILMPQYILLKWLGFVGYSATMQGTMTQQEKLAYFGAHFGSCPIILAQLWHDLTTAAIPEAALTGKEKQEPGFKMFMVAVFFLSLTNRKNARLMKSRFYICLQYLKGSLLRSWVEKIVALKQLKFIWS